MNDLLLLDHHKWISDAITHINCTAFLINFWPFGYHKPAHVRKEESTSRIVWIGMAVLILVMDPVKSIKTLVII